MNIDKLKEEIKEYGIMQLEDCEGVEGCELHDQLYNTSYYVVGTFNATQEMGDNAFEIIGVVKDYEQSVFGEVTTDLSDPEKVLNMYAYIVGEEMLQESGSLTGDCWGKELTATDLELIKGELN